MGPKLNIAIPNAERGWFIPTTDRFCQVVWKLSMHDQRLCHQIFFIWGINPATGVVGYEWECEVQGHIEHVSSTKDYKILMRVIHSNCIESAGRIPSDDLKRQGFAKDELQTIIQSLLTPAVFRIANHIEDSKSGRPGRT